MKTTVIDHKMFFLPDCCSHVAVNFDGAVHAYQVEPSPSEVFPGWKGSALKPDFYIGRLLPGDDVEIEDWRNLLFDV